MRRRAEAVLMTRQIPAAARSAAPAEHRPPPTEEACTMRERRNHRAGFWRLALGALGLFWVGVLLVLMG
jgi:hypothetical protein